jgi:hypothetical protein
MTRIIGTLSLALAVAAQAADFAEGFDGNSNVGGWTFAAPFESIAPAGGNPGPFLRGQIDAQAPYAHSTTATTLFTGDYRARGVTSVGADLITIAATFATPGRQLAVLLVTDSGTADPADDWAAYRFGADIPAAGQGWQSYDFAVPALDDSWPADWLALDLGPAAPDPDWGALMADVSSLGFFYGDPAQAASYIFQSWDVGLDNARITSGPVATQTRSWGGLKGLFK